MSIQQLAALNGVRQEINALAARMEELAKLKPETVQTLFSDYSNRLQVLYRRVDELERILRAVSAKFDKLLDRVRD